MKHSCFNSDDKIIPAIQKALNIPYIRLTPDCENDEYDIVYNNCVRYYRFSQYKTNLGDYRCETVRVTLTFECDKGCIMHIDYQ